MSKTTISQRPTAPIAMPRQAIIGTRSLLMRTNMLQSSQPDIITSSNLIALIRSFSSDTDNRYGTNLVSSADGLTFP